MLCKSDRCFYIMAVMSTWCGYYTLLLRASNQLRSCIHIQADIAAKIKSLQSEVVKRKHRMHLISCNPTSSVIHFQTLQVPRKTKVFGEEETECSRPSTRKTKLHKLRFYLITTAPGIGYFPRAFFLSCYINLCSILDIIWTLLDGYIICKNQV